jgi:hypothetical protein
VILVHSTVVSVNLTVLALVGLRVFLARLGGVPVLALALPRR